MLAMAYKDFSAALFGGLPFARKSRGTEPPPPSAPSLVVASVDAMNREMKCSRTDTAEGCSLRLEGALDIHSAYDVRALFNEVVAAKPAVVTLHLEGLTSLDSSGVGAIVSLFKRLNDVGGSLVVQGVQGQPLAVCKLLKLDRIFGF